MKYGFALLTLTLLAACMKLPTAKIVAEKCSLTSQCESPFVCQLDRCRVQCVTSRDCAPGLACIATDAVTGLGACQLPAEMGCHQTSECPGGLVCRDDGSGTLGSCVPQCLLDVDCPTGATCSTDTHQCTTPPVLCHTNNDCRDDAGIQNGICYYDGQCRAECAADKDCPAYFYCDTSSSTCKFNRTRNDSGVDAGHEDAGMPSDSGSDAGVVIADAGLPIDAAPLDLGPILDFGVVLDMSADLGPDQNMILLNNHPLTGGLAAGGDRTLAWNTGFPPAFYGTGASISSTGTGANMFVSTAVTLPSGFTMSKLLASGQLACALSTGAPQQLACWATSPIPAFPGRTSWPATGVANPLIAAYTLSDSPTVLSLPSSTLDVRAFDVHGTNICLIGFDGAKYMTLCGVPTYSTATPSATPTLSFWEILGAVPAGDTPQSIRVGDDGACTTRTNGTGSSTIYTTSCWGNVGGHVITSGFVVAGGSNVTAVQIDATSATSFGLTLPTSGAQTGLRGIAWTADNVCALAQAGGTSSWLPICAKGSSAWSSSAAPFGLPPGEVGDSIESATDGTYCVHAHSGNVYCFPYVASTADYGDESVRPGTSFPVPLPFFGMAGCALNSGTARYITAGDHHFCAMVYGCDGGLEYPVCWGSNCEGQLSRPTPIDACSSRVPNPGAAAANSWSLPLLGQF